MSDIFVLIQHNINDLTALGLVPDAILLGYEEYRFIQSLLKNEVIFQQIEDVIDPTPYGGFNLLGYPVYAMASRTGITFGFNDNVKAAKYSIYLNQLRDIVEEADNIIKFPKKPT